MIRERLREGTRAREVGPSPPFHSAPCLYLSIFSFFLYLTPPPPSSFLYFPSPLTPTLTLSSSFFYISFLLACSCLFTTPPPTKLIQLDEKNDPFLHAQSTTPPSQITSPPKLAAHLFFLKIQYQ